MCGYENGLKLGCGLFAFILLLPALFNFIVFWLYPNFDSILLSFKDLDGSFTLGNYQWVISELFASGGQAGLLAEAIKNTLIFFTVGYFIIQTYSILVAYIFYKKRN